MATITLKTVTEKELIENGGKVWDKRGRRIYLNNQLVVFVYSLGVAREKRGDILAVSVDGEEISRSKSFKFFNRCDKAYFDCETGSFVGLDTTYTF